jgi:hypothetical protein
MFTSVKLVLLALALVPASAQWLTNPFSRVPLTIDGKPNLSAPAPKLAEGGVDLSGIWVVDDNHLQFNLMADLIKEGKGVDLLPAAQALYQARVDTLGKDRPSGHCFPHGIPDAMLVPQPFKIMHTPGTTLILYEEFAEFRQIFTDGRALPKNPQTAWFGYSIGNWERDAFVIESRGFNDKTWLDDDGHPHSDGLHTFERFRRPDYGQMTMEITIDDPKTYAKPWSATLHYHLLPDTELIEFICENEKDAEHAVGK